MFGSSASDFSSSDLVGLFVASRFQVTPPLDEINTRALSRIVVESPLAAAAGSDCRK